MSIIQITPRRSEPKLDEVEDRFSARLAALSRTSRRPVVKRESLFDRLRTQPTRQEA